MVTTNKINLGKNMFPLLILCIILCLCIFLMARNVKENFLQGGAKQSSSNLSFNFHLLRRRGQKKGFALVTLNVQRMTEMNSSKGIDYLMGALKEGDSVIIVVPSRGFMVQFDGLMRKEDLMLYMSPKTLSLMTCKTLSDIQKPWEEQINTSVYWRDGKPRRMHVLITESPTGKTDVTVVATAVIAGSRFIENPLRIEPSSQLGREIFQDGSSLFYGHTTYPGSGINRTPYVPLSNSGAITRTKVQRDAANFKSRTPSLACVVPKP